MQDFNNTQGKYRHYKGNEYYVIGTGAHTETSEVYVVYRSLQHPETIWIRPYDMFFESLSVNGEQVPRFLKLED